MFKRILLATDGSPVTERQILYAEHLARVEPAEIVVVHAYAPPEQYAGYSGYDRLLEQYDAMAQVVVDEAVSELRDDGVAARGEVRVGPAAEALLSAAAEYDIDLIVLGRRSGDNLHELLGASARRCCAGLAAQCFKCRRAALTRNLRNAHLGELERVRPLDKILPTVFMDQCAAQPHGHRMHQKAKAGIRGRAH